jgi:hypothetical protein
MKVTNKILAKAIEVIKEHTVNYYGIEEECVQADDIISYLNEFPKESYLCINEECEIEILP